jgi:hypothetical protein
VQWHRYLPYVRWRGADSLRKYGLKSEPRFTLVRLVEQRKDERGEKIDWIDEEIEKVRNFIRELKI